jgi:type IV pilus assembly protein PilM
MDLPDFFGLDIGNHSIKVAEVDRKSIDKAKLQNIASIDTPFGILNSEDAVSKEKLASRVKEVVENSGIKTRKCIAALPEASIFTRLITVPKVNESKLEELVHWEAKQYIPLPLSEVQMDYILIEEKQVQGQTMLQLLLVAAPKVLVTRYTELVKMSGLELLALETETIATSRIVSFAKDSKEVLMALDFGATGTDLSVIKHGKLIFSQSLSTGSDALTKAISNDFGMEMAQAEQYKITYGLDQKQVEGKIYKSIEPIIRIISDEIARTLNFFRTHLPDSIPTKILLVGEGSKLTGLDKYLNSQIGMPVELTDLFSKIEMSDLIAKEVNKKDLIGYVVAVGLGLKTN